MSILTTLDKIDYVVVIYKNYDLLDLQISNFKNRFSSNTYNLIVVDNTPIQERKPINNSDCMVVCHNGDHSFDGVSHGGALDFGLSFVRSKVVGIIDSDFFFLNNNIHSYVVEKINDGYQAIGCEYNDGKDTKSWVSLNPINFENIPCCFGAFYDTELARSKSWIITNKEVDENRSTGFVEVGYKIRQEILSKKIKTLSWKTNANQYGNCFFENEFGSIMGFHYVAGSHRRWSSQSKAEIEALLERTYD